MSAKYRFIDLFAGIGGFRKSFEEVGFECVFSSEINESCRDVYQKNYHETPHGDITLIDPKTIPDHDILTAGFPCQPFSICGKRKGFEDTRGTLFFNICKIIEEKSPKLVLLENVKYLLHHEGGGTLKVIVESLESLGYLVSYKLLNAIHFGLPQNRERVIIIASKNVPFDFTKLKFQHQFAKIKDFLEVDAEFEFLHPSEYTLIENPRKQSSGLVFVGYRNKGIWKTGIRPNTEHLSRVHRQPNRIYSDMGTHPTIPSQETSGRFFVYLSNIQMVRKLTLRECYRMMGFSDDFQLHASRSECYKQVGNSVCVPMIKQIAQNILDNNYLEDIYEPSRKVIRTVSSQQEFIYY